MSEPAIIFFIFDDMNRIIDVFKLERDNFSELRLKCNCETVGETSLRKFSAAFMVDGYFMSEFIKLLNASAVYHKLVVSNFLNAFNNNQDGSEIKVKFQLKKPKLEVIDHVWNDKICTLINARQELESAMSWLSTLGGAFSALGDCFENCAKVAGRISVQQFKIAFKLGEPPLVARCKLYMALSLIQLGRLGTAKHLVQEQYQLAKSLNDFRLKNMCHGVWAKLQYVYKNKKLQKKKYCDH